MARIAIENPVTDLGTDVKAAWLANTTSHNANYLDLYQRTDYERNPLSHGYKAWTFPINSHPSIGTGTLWDGECHAARIWLPETISVTGVDMYVGSQVLVTPTPAEDNKIGVFTSAGTLICATADLGTDLAANASTVHRNAFAGGPFTLTGGDGVFIYVGILINATTPPSMAYAATPNQLVNAGLSTGNWHALYLGSKATMPATAAWLLTSAASSGVVPWFGLY